MGVQDRKDLRHPHRASKDLSTYEHRPKRWWLAARSCFPPSRWVRWYRIAKCPSMVARVAVAGVHRIKMTRSDLVILQNYKVILRFSKITMSELQGHQTEILFYGSSG